MADSYSVDVKSDGTAVVTVTWEITGTGLPDYLANNATQYVLAAPVDGSSWTAEMAVSAVSAQAEADKESWIAAQGSLPG
jgi:hypothetical protein